MYSSHINLDCYINHIQPPALHVNKMHHNQTKRTSLLCKKKPNLLLAQCVLSGQTTLQFQAKYLMN